MPALKLAQLVFVDESGARTNMTRLYGRCFDGQRVVDAVPAQRWKTTSILGSLRLDGETTAMVVNAPTDGDIFQVYVEQVLVKTLRDKDLVIMDNLSAHKRPAVEAAIRAVGAQVVFLPPYSPDLNPIEKMWSKIKAYLRKVKARTEETLWTAVGAGFDLVKATDAAGWFASCGYIQS